MIHLHRGLAVLLMFLATAFLAERNILAAEGAHFLSEREQQIVEELNRARKDPGSYVRLLRESLKYYEGKELKRPREVIIQTQEGKPAVEEAIRFLEKTHPVGALAISRGMSQAAKDLVKAQGKVGALGHISPDMSNPGERVNRYGRWEKTIGENIAYGPVGAKDVIASLIDDGVPDRGHRKNIFNPAFHLVGAACGSHAVYRNMCVITFAGGYTEK